jgi:large subunit ribosomal protein L18
MANVKAKRANLERRRRRVRAKVRGSAERPRLCVTRANRNVYAQLIDDVSGRTLVSASSIDPELRGSTPGATVDGGKAVGELLGRRAQDAGIAEVVFDRAGRLYHGRVEAVAEGARSAGLKF